MTHIGKIGCLPHEIRDELNRRLLDGEQGKKLVAWLNGLPDTQRLLAARFGGRPIKEQNLSVWRAGGYQAWLIQQETLIQARDLASHYAEMPRGRLTDHAATLLAARYATELTHWNGKPSEEFRKKLRILRGLCRDVVELQRGDRLPRPKQTFKTGVNPTESR